MSVEACQERLEELNNELARIVDVLVDNYNPQKIILFGSLVSGNVHEFSDIDLIVVKESDKGFYERLKEVGLLVMPEGGAEIFVYTPDEFELKRIPYFLGKNSSKKAGRSMMPKPVDIWMKFASDDLLP